MTDVVDKLTVKVQLGNAFSVNGQFGQLFGACRRATCKVNPCSRPRCVGVECRSLLAIAVTALSKVGGLLALQVRALVGLWTCRLVHDLDNRSYVHP